MQRALPAIIVFFALPAQADDYQVAFAGGAHAGGAWPTDGAQASGNAGLSAGLFGEVGWRPGPNTGAVGLVASGDLSTAGRHRLSAGAWGFIPFHALSDLLFVGAELAGGASYGFGSALGPALWWRISPQLRGRTALFLPGFGLFVRGDHALKQLIQPEVSAGLELDLLAATATAFMLLRRSD